MTQEELEGIMDAAFDSVLGVGASAAALEASKSLKRKTITIRGEHFFSQKAAAKHLGVSPSAISQAKSRGELDTIGLKAGGKQ